MRRRCFTPTASFTHGRGTNPNGSRQVRAQCNSASLTHNAGSRRGLSDWTPCMLAERERPPMCLICWSTSKGA